MRKVLAKLAALDVHGFFQSVRVISSHKLVQNFLQSLEPPFLVGGAIKLLDPPIKPTLLAWDWPSARNIVSFLICSPGI
jgi:hypothetical protein